MFEVISFENEHLEDLDALSEEDLRWQVNDFPTLIWKDRVKWQAMSGPSYSVIADGKVIACGGIAAHFPGVGELWMVTAEDAGKASTRLILAIVRNFENVATEFDFVRVQVVIPEGGRDFSRRLVERLGFIRETNNWGMRRCARDGSTCHLYAKVY